MTSINYPFEVRRVRHPAVDTPLPGLHKYSVPASKTLRLISVPASETSNITCKIILNVTGFHYRYKLLYAESLFLLIFNSGLTSTKPFFTYTVRLHASSPLCEAVAGTGLPFTSSRLVYVFIIHPCDLLFDIGHVI